MIENIDNIESGEKVVHPVTKRLIERTESGEILREKGFYGEKVWKLLKGETIKIEMGGSEVITLSLDGSGHLDDPENNLDLPIKEWSIEDDPSTQDILENFKEALDFIYSVGDTIPSGNLEIMGGIVGLVDSFIDVKNAKKYADRTVAVDPHKDSMGSTKNIPSSSN
jgi:hypothetical protein